jgi:hypothetical protein
MRKPAKKKASASSKKTKVKNVTPKTYNGVQYKSSLEAFCAQALTEAGLPVNYETWKVVLHDKLISQVESWEPKTTKNKEAGIKVRTFAPVSQTLRQSIYTPDFVDLEQGWIIETKGLRTEAFNLRYRLFKKWLADNGLHHMRLYMPGNHHEIHATVQEILKHRNNGTAELLT